MTDNNFREVPPFFNQLRRARSYENKRLEKTEQGTRPQPGEKKPSGVLAQKGLKGGKDKIEQNFTCTKRDPVKCVRCKHLHVAPCIKGGGERSTLFDFKWQ